MISTADNIEIIINKSSDETEVIFKNNFNEKGIIYRITAVLFVNGWSIHSATAKTGDDGTVEDHFTITPVRSQTFDNKMEKRVKEELLRLIKKEESVMQYLSHHPGKLEELYKFEKNTDKGSVEIYNSDDENVTVLQIESVDRPGLLFEISQLLYLLYIDILSFEAGATEDGVHDRFMIRREDGSLIDEIGRNRIKDALVKIL